MVGLEHSRRVANADVAVLVERWFRFVGRLSERDKRLLDAVTLGCCVKSASTKADLPYSVAQKRLVRWQERLGVTSLATLALVWRTLADVDHNEHAEIVPTMIEKLDEVAQIVRSLPS